MKKEKRKKNESANDIAPIIIAATINASLSVLRHIPNNRETTIEDHNGVRQVYRDKRNAIAMRMKMTAVVMSISVVFMMREI